MSDGRIQSEVSALATAYETGKGEDSEWKPIDTAVTDTGRKGFEKANTTNLARTYFGSRPGELVRFELDEGHWVAIGLKDAGAAKLTPAVDGNKVTYQDALGQGIDLSYTVGNGSVKEDIVLNERPKGAPSFEFTLTTGGLTAKSEKNGTISLYGENSPSEPPRW